jgi:hypothetical protein
VVVYPLVWVAVTLARGPFTGNEVTGAATYYPYPFLDPATEDGYAAVAVWIVVIAAFICGMALLLIAIGRRASRAITAVAP